MLCRSLCKTSSAALVLTSGWYAFHVLSGWSSTRTCGFWWRYGRYSAALSSRSASSSPCVYLTGSEARQRALHRGFLQLDVTAAAGEQQGSPYRRGYEYHICFFCVKDAKRRDVKLIDPPLVNGEPLWDPEAVSHVYHVAKGLESPEILGRPSLETRGDVCHINADSPRVAASHRPRNNGPVLTARPSHLSAVAISPQQYRL